jgi:hypothetical protein
LEAATARFPGERSSFILTAVFIYPLLAGVILLLCWGVTSVLGLAFTGFPQRLLPHSVFAQVSPTPEIDSIDEFIKRRDQLNAKEIPILDRLVVMREIDGRVARLRGRTSGVLAAIGLALVSAAIVVLFAGRLTSLDAEAVSNVDRAKTELADATRNLSRLYQSQSLLQQLEMLKKQAELPNPTGELQKAITEKKKELDNIGNSYTFIAGGSYRDFFSTPVDLPSAASMIVVQQKEVENLRDILDQVLKKELLADRGYGDWRYIVATAITRVGVVLIIVFLVQILLGLYRYNTKLIAYYNSRRDLLTLWEGDQNALMPLDQVLAPPQIDFGKEPRHPLADLMKAFGGKLNSIAGGEVHPTGAQPNKS